MSNIILEEWQTLGPFESDVLRGLILAFDKQTEGIAAELASRDMLEISQLRSGVRVRATSWVGRVTLGDFTVTIQPKITGIPLLNLLRYAYALRDLVTFSPTSYVPSAETFQDLIIEQLAEEATELLSRGLHRDYLRFEAELSSPTGRVDFSRFVHSYATASSSILCTYYNRSEAILLNQVLLAGLCLAGRLSTDIQLCARVFRLAQMIEPNVPTLSLGKEDIVAVRRIIDRRTGAYSSALTLIEMLVDGMGISQKDVGDRVQLSGFLFDMNTFFQALISRFLHDELQEFSVQDEHRLKDIFEYDPAKNPKRRRAPVPRPDFAITIQGRIVEFLDAKYRDLWERSLPREMLYQLAIYALSKTTAPSRSTILYPTLAADAIDQVILLKEPALGHKRAEIGLRPVDLLKMESLIRPRQGAAVLRRRREFARRLVFGSDRPAALSFGIAS